METSDFDLAKGQIIILTVDAQKLYGQSEPDENSIKSVCTITDSSYGSVVSSGSQITNFVTKVKPKQRITWVGESSSEDYPVSIDSIVMMNIDHNKDFFGRSTLLGNGGTYGTVAGRIKDKGLNNGDTYTYKINFSITNINGVDEPSKSYSLDPKLQIGQNTN